MKKGDILIYCGKTNFMHTENKKYIIKKMRQYMDMDPKGFFICITDDLGINNWYQRAGLDGSFFRTEKEVRKEKLKQLLQIK